MASPKVPARLPSRFRVVMIVLPAALALGAALVGLSSSERGAETLRAEPSAAPAPTPQLRRDLAQPAPARTSRVEPSRADAGAPGEAQEAPLGLLAKATLSREEERLLHEADEGAIAACMRGRGFRYLASPSSDGPDRPGAGAAAPKPGDVGGARAHGFGIAEAAEAGEGPPLDPNEEALEKMEPAARRAWREAFEGRPLEPVGPASRPGIGTVEIPGGAMYQWDRDSCLAQARRALYGDDVKHAEMIMTLNEVRIEAHENAQTDPAYRAGVERWRGCMSRRGLSYSEPGAAASDLADAFRAGQLTLDELRQREIEVATAEATCYGEAGLEPLFEAARARAEAEAEKQSRGALESVLALQAQALARARRGQ